MAEREYRRDDDERLTRIEQKLDTALLRTENRLTILEANTKWAGVIAGLVATFVSSVLLLFVTAWMRK
jgi:tetrahydromethanopterin S-methyltransferase subunit F